MQREARDERRQRRPPRITGNEHRLRGGRRRIERLEEAVDLAPALVVVVEESVQRRHHPSTDAHHDATNIVIVRGLVGDEDAVIVESAIGDEHVEMDVQLQGRAEALHKGDGAARRVLDSTSTKATAFLWQEMMQRIEAAGFTLWMIQTGFADPRDGRTLQLDAIFFRV